MNPQPEPVIGNIFATIFTLMILYYFFKEVFSNKEPIHINDFFTIGYIEDSNNVTVNVKNKIIKDVKNNFESQQLYLDCIDALHALGMKKTEAKKKAKEIFASSTNPPKTVQDFLVIAMRNNL